MSDFEVMPVGTAARLAELEAEVEQIRVELWEERRDLEKTETMCAEHCAELKQLRSATQLCDKHAPKGGTVAACVICSGQKLSYALSRISYLCEPPNEMEFSSYDLHYNEEAVVAQVERLRKDAERYRWLREPPVGRDIRVIMPTPYSAILSWAELDREIDAALKEGQR